MALDPCGVGASVDALDEAGISGQDGAVKTAERKLADGSLRHNGQGLMAWAVGNARVEPKGNAITITKQVSGTGLIVWVVDNARVRDKKAARSWSRSRPSGSDKINSPMAAFNAIALMALNPEAAREPGLFFV